MDKSNLITSIRWQNIIFSFVFDGRLMSGAGEETTFSGVYTQRSMAFCTVATVRCVVCLLISNNDVIEHALRAHAIMAHKRRAAAKMG